MVIMITTKYVYVVVNINWFFKEYSEYTMVL